MNILLTGANGFIGKHICQLYPDLNIMRVSRKQTNNDKCFYINELDECTDWANAVQDSDVVIHLAGLAHSNSHTINDYNKVNVKGTLRLAEEAAKFGVQRFIFVSTIGVNGTSTSLTPFSAEQSINPHNDYAISKYDAEIGLKKIAKETGLEIVIIRPTLVYGANAPGNFGKLTKLVSKLPCLPFGLAKNRRDFISVQNLADLLVTCAKHPRAAGHTFLAAESETVSIKQFTNAIAKGLDKHLIQLPIPITLMRLAGSLLGKSLIVDQLIGNLEVDTSNLKEVLDWVPPYTMEESMAFLKSQLR